MQKKHDPMRLLAVAVSFAMCSPLVVQAQTSQQSSPQSTTQSSSQSTTQSSPQSTTQGSSDGRSQAGQGYSQEGSSQSGTQQSSGMQTDARGSSQAGAQTGTGTMMDRSGQSSASAKLGSADRKAIQDMAMSSRAEIEMARLAESRGQRDDVKAYARQMADEHGRALAEVQAMAQTKGVTLPEQLDAKHRAKIAQLDKLSGSAFDNAYMKQAGVEAHRETHARLQKNMKDVKDPDLKAQVAKMTPVVEQHLRRAEALASGQATSMGESGTQGRTGSDRDTREPER